MERKFTGFCIPTASPLGMVIINSQNIDIRSVSNGIPVKLEEKTIERIKNIGIKW